MRKALSATALSKERMRRLLSLFFATAVTFGNVGDTLRLGEESSPDDLPYDATVECCVRNQLGLGVPIEVAPRPPARLCRPP